jgi:hypothetical protein
MSNSRSTWVRFVVALACVFLACEFAILDRWRISGSVVSDDTHQPIRDADVLVTFLGDAPAVPIPHSRRNDGMCLLSRVAKTDESGKFEIDGLTLNQLALNKRGTVAVYKDGWSQPTSVSAHIRSSLLATSVLVEVEMERDTGTRWSFFHDGVSTRPLTLDNTSEAYQRTMSRTLTEATNIIERACSYEAWPLLLRVLEQSAANARTIDEKAFLVRKCRVLEGVGKSLQARRRARAYWGLVSEPKYEFPFRCDDSLFAVVGKVD